MYVNKTHLQGPHASLYLPELFCEVPLLPAMFIFYDTILSVILLLMKEKMSHIKSVCAKTTQHTCEIHSVSDWPVISQLQRGTTILDTLIHTWY